MKNVNPNVNFILNCDSYKIQHRKMLKKHVDGYYSTIVPRKSSQHVCEAFCDDQLCMNLHLE